MADFRTFKATRYNLEKVKLAEVIAPPYDVISARHQAELYERSPHNSIRLILNREESSDSEQNDRYTRARNFFRQWLGEGQLTREAKPCFYLYRQTFAHPKSGTRSIREGLIGRLKLEPFEKGIVVAHEKTLTKPKADRLRLLEAAQTNFSSVFGLIEDRNQKLNSLTRKISSSAPFMSAGDDEKVLHEVWAVAEGETTEALHAQIQKKKIYIADGHHRYQTSLDYARSKRAEEKVSEDEERPYDFTLMTLVRFEDPGLVLLPTHRGVKNFRNWNEKEFLSRIENYFTLTAVSKEKLEESLAKLGQEKIAFGIVTPHISTLAVLKDLEAAKKFLGLQKPEVWYSLDVNWLAHLVFSRLMDLPEMDWESTLCFSHSTEEALQWIDRKVAAASFILRAPQVQILEKMGAARELMPQKSTYFYPKLASGLVFYEHVTHVNPWG